MRESGDGRSTVFPWGDACPAEPLPYVKGDAIANNYKPPSYGTVVSVDAEHGTISVEWDDAEGSYGAITYPADASYLRKLYPWEE